MLIPAVRQQKILDFVRSKDIAYINDLISNLNISLSTLRRDLKDLEREGKVEILRGGGVKLRKSNVELDLSVKIQLNEDMKKKIALKAVEYIENGDVIFMDPSSTTYMMIDHLKCKDGITVVTNSIAHVNKLISINIPVIMIGGNLKSSTNSCVGPIAESTLRELRFNKCFLGANGITINQGITNHDIREKIVKRIAIENSFESYFLIDSTKYGTVTMCKVADIDECFIITDSYFEEFKNYQNIIIADK